MYSLLSELQMPIYLRKDAIEIIKSKREEYNNINAKHINIPPKIREQVSKVLVKHKYISEMQDNPTCYQSTCEISYCCKINRLHKTNIAKTKRKLSVFFNINKILRKEILSLLLCYPDEIKEIIFDYESDIFKFKIHKKDFNDGYSEKVGKGITSKKIQIYKPINTSINSRKTRNLFEKK